MTRPRPGATFSVSSPPPPGGLVDLESGVARWSLARSEWYESVIWELWRQGVARVPVGPVWLTLEIEQRRDAAHVLLSLEQICVGVLCGHERSLLRDVCVRWARSGHRLTVAWDETDRG